MVAQNAHFCLVCPELRSPPTHEYFYPLSGILRLWRVAILVARTLLGAPGHTTRSKRTLRTGLLASYERSIWKDSMSIRRLHLGPAPPPQALEELLLRLEMCRRDRTRYFDQVLECRELITCLGGQSPLHRGLQTHTHTHIYIDRPCWRIPEAHEENGLRRIQPHLAFLGPMGCP